LEQDHSTVMGGYEQNASSNVVHVDFVRRQRVASERDEAPWGNLEAELDEAWHQAHLPPPETEPAADVFSAAEVARLTGLSTARLRKLDREGVVPPSSESTGRRAYTFRDLVVLRTVQELLAHGVKIREVVKAVQALRAGLPKAVRSLTELRIASDGQRVVARGPEGTFEALTGQLLLEFEVRQLRDDVVRMLRPRREIERRRLAFQFYNTACELDEDPNSVEEACDLYQKALAYDPTLSLAYTNLGNIRYRQGQEESAIDLYHRALDIDPAQPEALYNLGFCLLHRGNAASAIPFFEAATESNPVFANAQLYLAMAYELTGDRRQARPIWQRYLELEPAGEWAEYARQHL
jgi:tetratricopeptide (TPR) repeat protein